MKFLAAVSLFVSSSAFALGPLPDGMYSGALSCVSANHTYDSRSSTTILVEDTALTMASTTNGQKEENRKDFTIDALGFLKVKAPNGSGRGYLTENGVHYDITLNMGGLSVPGEDTFFFSVGKIYLVSSATIVKDLVKCEAVFSGNAVN